MNIFKWVKNRFSSRGKALALYRRGMRKAEKHNHPGAIDDYTDTIEMPDAPADVKAMARYNRALVYLTSEEFTKGVGDLNAVLTMDHVPPNIKKKARQKLAKTESRTSKTSV